MNDYIILCVRGGTHKKYRTPADKWLPISTPPASHRFTLLGVLDTTYGASTMKSWEGELIAYNTPATGFGTPTELMTVLTSKAELYFQDHFGAQQYVRAFGSFVARYLNPVWDSASNKAYIPVQLIKSGDV